MSIGIKHTQARAEAGFRKTQRAATARTRLMAEYVIESEKRQAQSQKLKALRLAKEAEDLSAALALAPKKQSSRKASKK